MLLTIKTIPEGRSVFSQNIAAEEGETRGVAFKGEIACRAEIDRVQTRICAHLFYRATVELECSRCLKKLYYPMAGDFFIILKDNSAEKNQNGTNDEGIDFFFNTETDEVDIRSAIIDEMILSLPMKPLCSETCPGVSAASHLTAKAPEQACTDPRWDELKKLVKNYKF